jgi:hypothetical protein
MINEEQMDDDEKDDFPLDEMPFDEFDDLSPDDLALLADMAEGWLDLGDKLLAAKKQAPANDDSLRALIERARKVAKNLADDMGYDMSDEDGE